MKNTNQSYTRPHSSPEDLSLLLRSRGLKATSKRLAVLAVLARSLRPLALHDIANMPETARITQSTLYRAINDCVAVGIVRSVDLRHTHAHYELATGPEHHHLICTSCEVIEEFVSKHCESIEHEALKNSTLFADIQDHSFELYGTCRACKERVVH
jgi:Fur family transcriptional regulator, ferric uptake regulator